MEVRFCQCSQLNRPTEDCTMLLANKQIRHVSIGSIINGRVHDIYADNLTQL